MAGPPRRREEQDSWAPHPAKAPHDTLARPHNPAPPALPEQWPQERRWGIQRKNPEGASGAAGAGADTRRRGASHHRGAVQRQPRWGRPSSGRGAGGVRQREWGAEPSGDKWTPKGCVGAAGHPHLQRPYLLLLHATQSLADELDVLARQRGQLAVACAQVHVLGAGRRRQPGSALPQPPAP